MIGINNYEKEEKRSFKDYETSELRQTIAEPNEWLAHKAGFKDGYQLGKAHTQIGTDRPHERTMIAAMAMQGLLASGMKKGIVARAIELTDSLIYQLNKPKNETDKED